MSLPDSFPKRFTITLGLDMEKLMDASITSWGRILADELRIAEITAADQIKDFRQRMRVFRYCGADPGENFKTDLRYAWVDIDGAIQLLRIDMLPLGKTSMNFLIGLYDGTYEEYVDEDGEVLIREVKKD